MAHIVDADVNSRVYMSKKHQLQWDVMLCSVLVMGRDVMDAESHYTLQNTSRAHNS